MLRPGGVDTADQTGLAALTILVVDDNPQFRTILGSVLAGAGVGRVYYAPDGHRGLETLQSTPIDVVYVDYEMPVMDGLNFLSNLRQLSGQARFTPVIMLTGHADKPRLEAARARGVTEFLRKPVTAVSILNRLNAVIMHPRPFVEVTRYFGPDRRRRQKPDYAGPFRRAGDNEDVIQL